VNCDTSKFLIVSNVYVFRPLTSWNAVVSTSRPQSRSSSIKMDRSLRSSSSEARQVLSTDKSVDRLLTKHRSRAQHSRDTTKTDRNTVNKTVGFSATEQNRSKRTKTAKKKANKSPVESVPISPASNSLALDDETAFPALGQVIPLKKFDVQPANKSICKQMHGFDMCNDLMNSSEYARSHSEIKS
jgi:hypothetical protein